MCVCVCVCVCMGGGGDLCVIIVSLNMTGKKSSIRLVSNCYNKRYDGVQHPHLTVPA